MTSLPPETKQLTLKDDGQIYWQTDPTNPLPGVPVARVQKGEAALQPTFAMLPELGLEGEALAAAEAPIRDWLAAYIARVLEPLVKLAMVIENTPAPVQGICDRVYAGLGIVPREEVADLITGLDADMRKVLRGRHVRLGPVLVFVPDLNKPAAVRLRALLWSLWNDKPLPAPVPRDGAVSQVIDTNTADPAFYQAIGYPLYGNRIIRIDMLDRVMNAIYEGVKDNQFQAKHQMAEWLGCSVPDLYIVLEAMGHKKVSDPADNAPAAADATSAEELIKVIPVDGDAPAVTESAPVEAAPVDVTTETPVAPVAAPAKPELATFKVWWPKKGGAKPERAARGPRKPKAAEKAAPAFEYLSEEEKQANAERQNRKREDRTDDGEKRQGRPGGKPGDKGPGRNVGGNRDGGGFGGGSKHKSKPTKMDKGLRLVSSAAAPASKPEDSPFAILNTLKFNKD